MDTIIKNVKLSELNITIAISFLNTQRLFNAMKINYQQNLDGKLKEQFLNT